MCRFVAYKGKPVLLADLVTRPEHSLIHQSFHSEEREEPLNGDGFGMGWYAPEIDNYAAVFTSISPAWSNRNLYRMAEKIYSPLVFAHVRAATSGLAVAELNCHPFRYGRYLWMHNGAIAEFKKVRRAMRASLSDDAYNAIEGTTDSEHAFAMFLDRLPSMTDQLPTEVLEKTLRDTIHALNKLLEAQNVKRASHLNFAVTDGASIISTRLVIGKAVKPPTLYTATAESYHCEDGVCSLDNSAASDCVMITSEPLTRDKMKWSLVPENSVISINPECELKISPW